MRAQQQKKAPDGLRYSRWIIVRNTLPELETTTMKTWFDWFPADEPGKKGFGPRTRKVPYTHYVRLNDIRLEIIFMALDKPQDQKKLLSLEATGIWFNEVREIQKELLDAATGRVGRYPSVKEGGCSWSGIIMDTNPPDDQHWFYEVAEEKTPENWEFFRQPSGMSDAAENLENLNQTPDTIAADYETRRAQGRTYYTRMLGGKTEEWVNVYVHGNYGFIQEGRAVYKTEWNDDLHCAREPLAINPSGPVIVGVDCSGRNPAAVFLQRTGRGQLAVVHELVCKGVGAQQFAQIFRQEIQTEFPDNNLQFWGDPAGGWKAQNNEETYYDILRTVGIIIRPAHEGLRISPRVEAVKGALNELVEGEPRLIVSPSCKMLRKGFNGGYNYKRYNTAGGPKYAPEPDKRDNPYADVHDALQYAMVGAGEVRKVRGRNQRAEAYQGIDIGDWNVW